MPLPLTAISNLLQSPQTTEPYMPDPSNDTGQPQSIAQWLMSQAGPSLPMGGPTQNVDPTTMFGQDQSDLVGPNGTFVSQNPLLSQTPGAPAQPTAPDDPFELHAIKAALPGLQADLLAKNKDIQGFKPKEHVSLGSRFNTKDLLAGLLPLAVMVMSGKNGQQLAGGYAGGYLQGKQRDTELANQNIDYSNNVNWSKLTSAQQSSLEALKYGQDAVRQAQQMTAQYMTGGFKDAELERKKDKDDKDLIVKLKDQPVAQAQVMANQSARWQASGGRYGTFFTEDQIQAAAANMDVSAYIKSKTGALDALTGKREEETRGKKIANDLQLRMEPINLNAGHLKNDKLRGEISKLNEETLAIPKKAELAAKSAEARFRMDEAHANLYGAMASVVKKQSIAAIDKTYAMINRWSDQSAAEFMKLSDDQKKDARADIMAGYNALSGEFKNLDDSIARIQKSPEYQDEDGDDTPLHDLVDTYSVRQAVLMQSLKGIADGKKSALKNLGFNEDGSVMTPAQKKLKEVMGRKPAQPQQGGAPPLELSLPRGSTVGTVYQAPQGGPKYIYTGNGWQRIKQ